ncbi:hypothetical protein [Brevundimonas sp.]|uniref:hypothetical protein n=1 Tax=Brevundimonas sp. TaxID=1871086 RepID=UPI00391CF44C
MEQMTFTPSRRLEANRAYGRMVDAFETVAWRPPSATRFDSHVANDAGVPSPVVNEWTTELPGWVTVIAGGLAAALAGALMGGMLQV